MPVHEEIRQWILTTVQLIVDNPADVSVEATITEDQTVFKIQANSEDVGKVIGRQGRTARSLRILAGAMGKKFQWHFVVEIEESTTLADAQDNIMDP